MSSAPGWPGIPARWTSSAKSGIGTALSTASRVWFSLSHGVLNEVYYPRVDSACTRDLGFIVTDGASYFSEEKRHARSTVTTLAPGVPGFHLRNASFDGCYVIEKDVVTDPAAPVVLQRVRFAPAVGARATYRLFALLAPHLNNRGSDNTAWLGDYKGVPMLFASREGYALALACSTPWLARSAGFVGVSDGWQQLRAHGCLETQYDRAEHGNIALVGEVDLVASGGLFVVALAFGLTWAEAGQQALSSMCTNFDDIASEYVDDWQRWQRRRRAPACTDPELASLAEFSAALLRVHESKIFRGGVIASLSIPWGFSKGDNDLGGYHLVWPRDLVEAAEGLLAAGAYDEARRILRFLDVTQEADGHWCQNMWLDGTPYWNGIQMDETALPILLVDLATRVGALSSVERQTYWPMIRRAAGFIVRNGPVSPQDRWEEDPGYSLFTIAVEIVALLIAADDADANGQAVSASYLRETADAWYSAIDTWMYVTDSPLTHECGVDGYYARVAWPEQMSASAPKMAFATSGGSAVAGQMNEAALVVSPDALALVRFGLRRADDPRIVNTVRVIDRLLKVDTPHGPAWRRYNGDHYGERVDGRPFDGNGVGRPWPLLTGERAHYEVAAGRFERARALACTMSAFAGDVQLLPEQVWDTEDIPARELFRGEATGSARPLVWAHAEFVKLCRSIRDRAVFDQPRHTMARYLEADPPASRRVIWRFNNKIRSMRPDAVLRIETLARTTVHLGVDGWTQCRDLAAVDTGLGVWIVDVDVFALRACRSVEFTFYWPDVDRWEGQDYQLTCIGA